MGKCDSNKFLEEAQIEFIPLKNNKEVQKK